LHGETSNLLTSVLLLLCISNLLIMLLYRVRINSLLAFVMTGALLGPTGLALITDPKELTAFDELGFYHSKRMGFMDRESGTVEIIHAERLPRKAFVYGKQLQKLKPPEDLTMLPVHRDTLILGAQDHRDFLQLVGDVVLLRLVDRLGLGVSYLLRG
jgi:hypothetical protein